MPIWNPWHGCKKFSEGCQNCYVYRRDESVGRDASLVTKTNDFDLPVKRSKDGGYKLTPEQGIVFTCMTSDFFLDEADEWRSDCWRMMRRRNDLEFFIITKRIHRFEQCIPPDWGEGYPNVTICCTCENQKQADYRLPLFVNLPIRHRQIIHEPMLGRIRIEEYLSPDRVERVICGGESGPAARPCDYSWVLYTRQQCLQRGVSFGFKQTGAVFVKDGKTYRIPRRLQHEQAKKAGIDFEASLLPIQPQQETPISHEEWLKKDIFERIKESKFRSSFRLRTGDKNYAQEKGREVLRSHAMDFIRTRLAPAEIPNDGKQTPMRGHPVFLAQHACGCCCRGCLEKWHGIPGGTELTEEQQSELVDILLEWIDRQLEK